MSGGEPDKRQRGGEVPPRSDEASPAASAPQPDDSGSAEATPQKTAQESEHFRAAQQREAYVRSQREYFDSMSEGMSAQGVMDRGGVKTGTVQTIGSGAEGIVAAGGERKGSVQTIGSGAAGIVAAGGYKTGLTLGIGSTFRDQLNAATWGSGMQKYRTLAREYKRKEKEKKKNDGGLTAARQTYAGVGFFPHRPMMKIGGVMFVPMTFDGATPMVGAFKAAEEGWSPVGEALGATDTMTRIMLQAGRRYRESLPR